MNKAKDEGINEIMDEVEKQKTRIERGLLDCMSRPELIVEDGTITIPKSGCYMLDTPTAKTQTDLTRNKL